MVINENGVCVYSDLSEYDDLPSDMRKLVQGYGNLPRRGESREDYERRMHVMFPSGVI